MSAGQLQRSAPPMPGGAPSNSRGAQAVPQLPFVVGSRNASRFSFTLPTTALGASSAPLPPVQIPAVGYLKGIELEVTIAGSGGTSPTFTADAPFNALAAVELRNSSGNDLIVPVTGYQLFLINKYGCHDFDAPMGDMRLDPTYTAVSPSAHFIARIPCEISPADAFGAIPALASNRSYQLQITLAALGTVISSNPVLNVTIVGTAIYWTEPVASTASGVQQATSPLYNGSLNLWQLEPLPVTPGDKYIKSNNVGNVLRTLIFTLRTSAGARTSADWPGLCELYLDNFPMFYFPTTQWQSLMARWYQLRSASLDVAGGLDTGVFVVPFFALAEGAAIANARRSQYLPTLDTALLQLRGTSWGAAASTLEILTNSVQPVSPTTGSSSAALYGIS